MANRDGYTDMGGSRGSFPTTHWTQLAALRAAPTTERRAVLSLLIERYWRPVYLYLRQKGYTNEDAKDLVQEFFTTWIEKDLFRRADPARGRFRALLLSSLDNFLANVHRAAHAQRREPRQGILSIDELAKDSDLSFEPSAGDTPELVFGRTWAVDLLLRVLKAFEDESRSTGKEAHYEIFRRCILDPALHGSARPSDRDLAQEFRLAETQVANCRLTARRAYQRLLWQEIRLYATSDDDVASEIRDVFRFLARE